MHQRRSTYVPAIPPMSSHCWRLAKRMLRDATQNRRTAGRCCLASRARWQQDLLRRGPCDAIRLRRSFATGCCASAPADSDRVRRCGKSLSAPSTAQSRSPSAHWRRISSRTWPGPVRSAGVAAHDSAAPGLVPTVARWTWFAISLDEYHGSCACFLVHSRLDILLAPLCRLVTTRKTSRPSRPPLKKTFSSRNCCAVPGEAPRIEASMI